ncbi:MAG: hypothetical protein AAFW73_16270 [Bacteroidota bacterium]
MNLEQAYQQYLLQLENIPHRVNVFFEAHSWGRFRLLTNEVELFSDPQGYRPFAQIQSPPYDQWLLLDPTREHILLRHGDDADPVAVATSLEEFWTPSDWEGAVAAAQPEFYFDRRVSLEQLLPPDSFLHTPFRDPEAFETPEAYVQLLQLVAQVSQQSVAFDEVHPEIRGHQQVFRLRRTDRTREIIVSRTLFDQDFIHQLNQLIGELALSDRRLATSISPDLTMILLWLLPDQRARLQSRGMLL